MSAAAVLFYRPRDRDRTSGYDQDRNLSVVRFISVPDAFLTAAALMPKIALRGREGLKLKAIRLHGRNLALEIGLLRLSDSGAKSAVGAFTRLAQAAIPKMIASSAFA